MSHARPVPATKANKYGSVKCTTTAAVASSQTAAAGRARQSVTARKNVTKLPRNSWCMVHSTGLYMSGSRRNASSEPSSTAPDSDGVKPSYGWEPPNVPSHADWLSCAASRCR